MHWPHKPKRLSGEVVFEGHAAWCPVEVVDAAAFGAELAPQCECIPSYRLNGVRIGCFPPMKPLVVEDV